MSRIFIDTNILVYTADKYDLKKQRLCREALSQLEDNGTGVISTQVVQEFYVTLTRKLGMPPLAAKHIIDSFDNFEVVQIDLALIKEAIDCSILNQISFWDALVVVCAQNSKCDKIWTEDLTHHQAFKNVRVENILVPG